MENFEALLKAKRNIVGEIFIKAGVNDATKEQLDLVVAIAHRVRFKGYTLEMVAENLMNEKNLEIVKEVGLDRLLKAAVNVKYPSIQAKKFKPNRNSPCPCGSGLKFKICCIKKIQ